MKTYTINQLDYTDEETVILDGFSVSEKFTNFVDSSDETKVWKSFTSIEEAQASIEEASRASLEEMSGDDALDLAIVSHPDLRIMERYSAPNYNLI